MKKNVQVIICTTKIEVIKVDKLLAEGGLPMDEININNHCGYLRVIYNDSNDFIQGWTDDYENTVRGIVFYLENASIEGELITAKQFLANPSIIKRWKSKVQQPLELNLEIKINGATIDVNTLPEETKKAILNYLFSSKTG
jgi:hypothetical protein